jgi:plasmid stabilization system protein ParE
MSLIILDEAKEEINELVAWYNERNPAVAARLVTLFEEEIVGIASNPLQYPLMEMRRNPGNVRRVRLKGFPIYIGYQFLVDDVVVFAVAHTARRPAYWRRRLQN